MGVASNIGLHSLVELAESVGDFPGGRRGGVVDEYEDGTLLVELSDDPALDVLERMVVVAPEKLRLVEPDRVRRRHRAAQSSKCSEQWRSCPS